MWSVGCGCENAAVPHRKEEAGTSQGCLSALDKCFLQSWTTFVWLNMVSECVPGEHFTTSLPGCYSSFRKGNIRFLPTRLKCSCSSEEFTERTRAAAAAAASPPASHRSPRHWSNPTQWLYHAQLPWQYQQSTVHLCWHAGTWGSEQTQLIFKQLSKCWLLYVVCRLCVCGFPEWYWQADMYEWLQPLLKMAAASRTWLLVGFSECRQKQMATFG